MEFFFCPSMVIRPVRWSIIFIVTFQDGTLLAGTCFVVDDTIRRLQIVAEPGFGCVNDQDDAAS